ncbi:hypothetical protein ACWEPH_23800 [Nocardia beijingensis]|uniref:hypothetical protein n=1 Tax=Nocardia beijingensis TaxID=95162 RepID=UPI001894278E|nr:hypothetical protein [Nocardia beijingensis]MBF6075497.1 hypothetical protein [Nocardia beijingensis]
MSRTDQPAGNGLATSVAAWAAAARPDEPAFTELRFRGQEREPVTLTYARLPAAAGALAARLRRESAPGDRVGILCARTASTTRWRFSPALYSNRVAVPLFPAAGARPAAESSAAASAGRATWRAASIRWP